MKLLRFLLLFAVTIVNAQNDTIKLNDVSITASRFKMEAVSGKVILTDSIKKQYFSQETPTIFSNTPSIVAQSDNGTPFGYTYFTLRGMGQNRINYTLNGIPLNDGEDLAVYTSNYTDLISSLNSVQIIRGAGVSANGSSALAGLVNLELNSPFNKKSGEFESMAGSFNSYRVSGKYNFGTKNGFGATVRASSTSSDGFRDYSSGRSYSFGTSFGWKDENTSVIFNIIQGKTKNGQAWLPVPEGMPVTTNILTEMGVRPQYDDFASGIYQFQLNGKISEKSIFNTSYYLTTIDGNYDIPSFTEPNYIKNLRLKSANFGGYLNVKYSNNGFVVQPGINFNKFQRQHIGSSEFPSDYYNNTGHKDDYSGYVKSSYSFNNYVIEADAQLRNTTFWYETADTNTNIFEHNFFNYSAGLSYQGFNIFKPYTRFTRSNREPSRTNIFGAYDHYTPEDASQLASVKPESVNDIEVGTKIKSKSFNGNLNIYTMFFNNEIVSTGQLNSMGIAQGINVDKSQRLGIEGDFTYNIKKFNIGGNFNASKNTIWIDGVRSNPLSTPGFISNVMLIYKPNKLSLGTQYKYVTYSYLDNTNNFILPEYHLLDANIGYEITGSATIKLFVNNILDKNWTLSGNTDGVSRSFYYSSGINFFTTFSYKF